jgi:hypothetical protein
MQMGNRRETVKLKAGEFAVVCDQPIGTMIGLFQERFLSYAEADQAMKKFQADLEEVLAPLDCDED